VEPDTLDVFAEPCEGDKLGIEPEVFEAHGLSRALCLPPESSFKMKGLLSDI
jgi:hypothetical protein